jgi:hypothetical protein
MPDWEIYSFRKFDWPREAEAAAEKLPSVLTFLNTLKKQKLTPMVNESIAEVAVLEGFKTIVYEFDANNPEHQDKLELLREGLRIYKQRAAKVLPLLLRIAIPFKIRFDHEANLFTTLGHAGSESIEISIMNAGSLRVLVQVLAHETAHQIYEGHMSAEKKNFWNAATSYRGGILDLREVLKEWKPSEPVWEFDRRLKLEDPIMYLQIEASTQYTNTLPKKLRDNWSRESLQEYLETGGDPLIKAPKFPITGYGSTNGDESFAEAIATIVANGPMALHPVVQSWLKSILPEVKLASRAVMP